MKIYKKNTKVVNKNDRQYQRVLETDKYIFFFNYDEDKNSSVKMYNRSRKLISETYFAYETFIDVLQNNRYSWIAKKLSENLDKLK